MIKHIEKPNCTRWHYICVKSDHYAIHNEDQQFLDKLVEYGVGGYELVSLSETYVTNSMGNKQKHLTAWMKRKFTFRTEGDETIVEYE